MDIEHPEITRSERTGYHDIEYSRWELQQQEEAEEEEEVDELWLVEWQKEKGRN